MMSRFRQGFVASLLALPITWVGGCGQGTEPTVLKPATDASALATKVADVETPKATQAELPRSERQESSKAATPSVSTIDDTAEKPSILPVAGEKASAEKPKSETEKPRFLEWPKPAAALILSGEQHGFLEPCGCAENQSGGISRRHDLVKQIQAKNWPLSALDLGGTVNRNRPQTKLKFQTFLAAMKDMRYSVLNLGPEELKLGAADLLAQHTPNEKDPLGSLGFVSANVTLFGSPELGTPIRFKVLSLGNVKIGATSILGASFREEVAPAGANVDITIADPESALPPVLNDLQAQKPDLLVLLSHGSLAEAKSLAKKFPQFSLVLTSGGPEDPEFDNPQKVDNTLLVQVGHKGKYTGVFGFYPDDAENRLRFELVKLTAQNFQDSDTMVEHMRLYQELLKDSNLAENEPSIKHPSGSKFVGSKVCGECHSKAYEIWKDSGHAHAYDSLITGRPELKHRWVSRIYDPECLSCHVTGWHPQDVLRYGNGFVSKEKTPELLHNGCENCHGPGSKHIQLIDAGEKEAAAKEVRLTLEEAKKTQCVTCHDHDNSPKFNSRSFDKYWDKIKHKGLD